MTDVAQVLVNRYGRTYAEDTGINLRDKPSPLWRLLVLSLLLSARIGSDIAVATARELSTAGWRTPEKMRASTWQQRVDALGRGGYRRYDERTATQLGEAADLLITRWSGDLRRLHDEADESAARAAELLQVFNGIGPAGAAIFLREVQCIWSDLRPYVDDLALEGAQQLGLPTDPDGLYDRVGHGDFHRLVIGCVRAARDADVRSDTLAESHRGS